MTNVKVELRNRDILGNQELGEMLEKAQANSIEFFKARDSCVIALLRLTGKRREEIAILPMENVWIAENNIFVKFLLVKRRKNPDKVSLKKISTNHQLARYILDYLAWLSKNLPDTKFFFPSNFYSGLTQQCEFDFYKHLSGSQIYRIVKKYNPQAWCHLFRDTVGADIAKSDPTLMAVFRIKQRLDHVNEQTAWKYLRRYAGEVVGEEIIS